MASPRIIGTRIDVIHVHPAAVWSGRGAIAGRQVVRLTVEDEAGRTGLGEAAPLPGWSREDAAQVRSELTRIDWDRAGAALRATDREAATRAVGAMLVTIDQALPSLRFAVESALLDLVGQRLELPAWRLLAGHGQVEPLPLSSLLTAGTRDPLLAEARRALGRGVRTLKWKIGRAGGFDEELAVLRALRAEVGSEVALRLDANGALPDELVAARLASLLEVAPEFVEEPGASPLESLPLPPVPLAADESLSGLVGARDQLDGEARWQSVARAIRGKRCAVIVLKPALLGGVLACLELARRARALGAAAVVTHTFDGPVSMAAAAALALALPSPRRAAGLDRHATLDAWPAASAIALPMLGDATLLPLAEAGLGLTTTAPKSATRS